jgi:hypothetical protein
MTAYVAVGEAELLFLAAVVGLLLVLAVWGLVRLTRKRRPD